MTPAQAMKKVVWSETLVEGGKPLNGVLPKPPSTAGPFQNIGEERRSSFGGAAAPPPEFYADAAVIAYRLPDGEKTLAELRPRVTSSGGRFALASLTDGDVAPPVGCRWRRWERRPASSLNSPPRRRSAASRFRREA